jgi:hypothetical protein
MKIRDDINAKKEDRSGTKAKQETISMWTQNVLKDGRNDGMMDYVFS